MVNEVPGPGDFRLLPVSDYERVRGAVRQLVDVPFGVESHLRSAVSATLATPGSLWRAQLAWATARAEGLDAERALALACAVEAFHVASLLLDDLPAMDDAQTRRGRPCVHRLYGESAALLAALAFVHEGHLRVGAALDEATEETRGRARRLLSESLGLTGILDGQARDLHPGTRPASRDEVLRQAAGKSVPLLVLALEFPATVAGALPARSAKLRRLAECLGLAYQLLDDLVDAESVAGEISNASRDLGGSEVRSEIVRQLEHALALAVDLGGELAPVIERTVERLCGAGKRRIPASAA